MKPSEVLKPLQEAYYDTISETPEAREAGAKYIAARDAILDSHAAQIAAQGEQLARVENKIAIFEINERLAATRSPRLERAKQSTEALTGQLVITSPAAKPEAPREGWLGMSELPTPPSKPQAESNIYKQIVEDTLTASGWKPTPNSPGHWTHPVWDDHHGIRSAIEKCVTRPTPGRIGELVKERDLWKSKHDAILNSHAAQLAALSEQQQRMMAYLTVHATGKAQSPRHGLGAAARTFLSPPAEQGPKLTLAEAKDKRLCRICGGPMNVGGGETYHFGSEYSHTSCYERWQTPPSKPQAESNIYKQIVEDTLTASGWKPTPNSPGHWTHPVWDDHHGIRSAIEKCVTRPTPASPSVEQLARAFADAHYPTYSREESERLLVKFASQARRIGELEKKSDELERWKINRQTHDKGISAQLNAYSQRADFAESKLSTITKRAEAQARVIKALELWCRYRDTTPGMREQTWDELNAAKSALAALGGA